MKVYGIKTCGSVKKALQFLKQKDIAYEFIDLKKEQVGEEKIAQWLEHVEISKLFNSRGTKYRTLGLKELHLDDAGKKQWLAKENMLIKRPVIEFEHRVIVGFDASEYEEVFA